MDKYNKISSRKIGLDIGLSIGRFFLNTEDLHYGYWPKNKNASVNNLTEAQHAHSKLIIDNIPKNTKKILDVGCGSGNLALKLVNLGYKVDCIVPSKFLADQVSKKLGQENNIYVSIFETFNELNKYDLILFSESFQYIKLNESLNKIIKILNLNGHLLICDFFRRDIPEKSPMGGGHSWKAFQELITKYPFTLIKNIDITNETAPTIDLLAKFNSDVVTPMVEMSNKYFMEHYPKITKLLKWKFKKRLNKIYKIYLSGNVNGKCFKKFKKYHLLIYKKQ